MSTPRCSSATQAERSARHSRRDRAVSDPHAREEAILLLKTAAVDQIESLQTMLDAAVLAAEQVQDKRLELLEEGPEVTAVDIFIEFAIVFALDVKLVGRFVGSITKQALRRRVQQQELLRRVISDVGSSKQTYPVSLL